MTVVIHNGIAENPVKPGDHLLLGHFGSVLQSARKRRLEDIFGGGPRFDAAFEEAQKTAMCADQPVNRFRR